MSDLINKSESFMNDLIRRKDVLALFSINDCSDKMIGLYEKVLDVPTAYNPEKVVEEIIEASQGACHYCGCDLNSEDAIDIVKRGEVE